MYIIILVVTCILGGGSVPRHCDFLRVLKVGGVQGGNWGSLRIEGKIGELYS